MSTLLSMIVSWAINIIYILSLFPQLVTNYRRGSVAGMSPLMMWASWNGYALYAIYATGVDLPLAYKVCVPLWLICSTMLTIQKIYYTKGYWWAQFYLANSALLGAVFVASQSMPVVNLWSGWCAVWLWSLYFIPQIYRNIQMKSVKGLSRSFVALTLTGAILEFCYGQIIGMPLPTRMNALREVVVVGVLFYKYIGIAKRQSLPILIKRAHCIKALFCVQ